MSGEGPLGSSAMAMFRQAMIPEVAILDVSLQELARLFAAQRLQATHPLIVLKEAERTYPLLRTDAAVAWRAATLDWTRANGKEPHRDPADRALVAAALVHGMTLVTGDRELHTYSEVAGFPVLW